MCMKTKDCFYGQVRAVTETHNGQLNTWTPDALNITKQSGVTWDNNTGMNPLYDQATVPVIHYSYGEVLKIAADKGFTFITDFIEPNRTAEFYDDRIKEDFNSHYARLALAFAPFWGMEAILIQPDNNLFDFIVTRQFDTFWKSNNPRINENIERLLGADTQQLSAHTKRIHQIPFVYMCAKNFASNPKEYEEFPVFGASLSSFVIFNNVAMKRMRGIFFQKFLEEIEIMYRQIEHDMQTHLHSWQMGFNMARVFMKCNVHIIDMYRYNLLGVKPGWNVDVSDNFAHIERATGESD